MVAAEAQGGWTRTGDGEYTATTTRFLLDEGGRTVGTVKSRQTIKLNSPAEFEAAVRAETVDSQGAVVRVQTGVLKGRRLGM